MVAEKRLAAHSACTKAEMTKGERGQSNCELLASYFGRPQQFWLLFNQENTGSVSDPFGAETSGVGTKYL